MISLGFSLEEGEYLISLTFVPKEKGETTLKPACIITKLYPDIKSASSKKLALLNFLVETKEISSLSYRNCSS